MHHIAIMKPSWHLIPKILSGEKIIESRWYKHRVAPWNKVHTGDIVYFKDSGKPVTAKTEVEQVLQFENLNRDKAKEIIDKYNDRIKMVKADNLDWFAKKNYCILIFLKNPQPVEPFNIDKTGFGNAAAWLCVKDIQNVMVSLSNP